MIKIWGQPCTVRRRRGPGGGWPSSRSHGAGGGLSWPGGSSYPSAPPAPWQPRAKSQTPGHAAGTSGGRNVRLGAPDLLQQQRRPLGLCGRRAALLPTELQLTEGSTGATVLRTVPLLTPLPGAPGLDPSRPTACWEDSLCPGAAPDLHQGVSRVESGGVTTWRMKDPAPRTAVVTPTRHAGQMQQHKHTEAVTISRAGRSPVLGGGQQPTQWTCWSVPTHGSAATQGGLLPHRLHKVKMHSRKFPGASRAQKVWEARCSGRGWGLRLEEASGARVDLSCAPFSATSGMSRVCSRHSGVQKCLGEGPPAAFTRAMAPQPCRPDLMGEAVPPQEWRPGSLEEGPHRPQMMAYDEPSPSLPQSHLSH